MKRLSELTDQELVDEFLSVVNSSEGLPGVEYYEALQVEILLRMSSRPRGSFQAKRTY